MQSLRDQLQKAGLINKQQKQQVEQDKRRERKQHRQAPVADQAQARQAYEAKLAAQRAADRERAASQRAEQETKETHLRIQHLIDYWAVPVEAAANRRWYFTTRHNTITYLYVPDSAAAQLGTGALAIVERPDAADAPFTLVGHEAAALIAHIDPQYVRFHNRQPADDSDL